MTAFASAAVAEVFAAYPAPVRARLLALREIIFDVAAHTEGVGKLTETLKWGEPAYVTESGSGSTIRIDRCRKSEGRYGIYFHCQTTLVESFRTLFPTTFNFEGNRSMTFAEDDRVPVEEVRICIAMALTYHQSKRRSDSSYSTRSRTSPHSSG